MLRYSARRGDSSICLVMCTDMTELQQQKQCTSVRLVGLVVFDRPAVFDFSRISPAAENCCSSFSQTSRSKIAGYWLSPFALMATPQTHHERVELMLLLLSVLVLCCCRTVVLVLWQDGWMDAAAAQLWLCVCVWAVAPTFHILLSNQFLCSAQKCNQISLFMHHHHTFNDAAYLPSCLPYVLNFYLFNLKLEVILPIEVLPLDYLL